MNKILRVMHQKIDLGSSAGKEPELYAIVYHYYASHGIEHNKANRLAYQYLDKLVAEIKALDG